jgi:hypothetical protein
MKYDDMKGEMFRKETIRVYLLDKRTVIVKINYENGIIDMNIKNYQTIGN